MFGGLDIKGGGSSAKKDDETAKTTEAAAPPAPSASSGFSFLSGLSSPSSTAAPPSSGFSFLNTTATEAASEPEKKETSEPASSGFSFLSNATASTNTGEETPAVVEEETKPPLPPTTETASATSSSFGFMQQETPPDNTQRSSSFGFMSASENNTTASSTVSRDDESTDNNNNVTRSNSGSATDLLAMASSSTNSNTAAAGAGISFGAVATKKPVKKRNRTAKIGAAANATLPTPPRPMDNNNKPNPMTMSQTSEGGAKSSALDAAAEANKRAEEFLHEKLRSEIPPIASVPSEEDEVIVAAKAAAEEAHKLEQERSHSSRGGFTGLFRSRARSPPASRSASGHGPTLTSLSAASSASSDGMDKIQKEQKQAKRAMAERQLHLMQQQQNNNNETHDEETASDVAAAAAPSTNRTTMEIPDVTTTKPLSFIPPVETKSRTPTYTKPSTTTPVVDVFSAPKPKTSTDKFHDMLDEFRYKVIQTMEEVMKLRQHKNGLLEERFVTTAKERLAVQQKEQALQHQAIAAEQEDFELADKMQTVIESHEREQVEYAAVLVNISRALVELEEQKKKCVDDVTKHFHNIQTKLKEFQKEQISSDNKDATETLKKFEEVSKQLSIENDRLQSDWKHLQRDAELVAEERNELEKAISEQAGEYEKLRDQARSQLQDVEQDIEDLRRQIAAKQKIAAQLRTEAAGHDEAVLRVRVKFSRQLNRVQKKEITIKDNQEEWESEKKTYEVNKEEHDAKVNQHSEAMLAREKLLEALHKEVEMADTFEAIVSKEIGFEVSPEGEDSKEKDDGLAQLQADVVRCEAAVSEGKTALDAVTKALHDLEKEVETLEFQIPQLEEIKKAAASRRDFKGAGKASKEIKEYTARLAECKAKLDGDAMERKTSAEKELKELTAQLESARKIANEKERESGVKTMSQLADVIKRLVATKASVCADCNEKSIQGVGAFVLDAQIKALKMEGQTYGDKYGGWDELMAEFDDTTTTEEKSKDNDTDTDKQLDSGPTSKDESNEAATEEGNIESKEEVDSAGKPEDDGLSQEEKFERFREVSKRLKEAEENLEKAVAGEDYDKAAELDEVLQQLLGEVQDLNLTDEEMESALASSTEGGEETKDDNQITPTSEAANGYDGSSEEQKVNDEIVDVKDDGIENGDTNNGDVIEPPVSEDDDAASND